MPDGIEIKNWPLTRQPREREPFLIVSLDRLEALLDKAATQLPDVINQTVITYLMSAVADEASSDRHNTALDEWRRRVTARSVRRRL